VKFFYFGISYDNPCSPLSFSPLPLPAPGSRTNFVPHEAPPAPYTELPRPRAIDDTASTDVVVPFGMVEAPAREVAVRTPRYIDTSEQCHQNLCESVVLELA
jgi:hypothetical protein